MHLAAWGMSLTAPASSLAGLGYPVPPATAIPRIDASLQTFWRGLVELVVHGWVYAYFWSAAALVYLLLRHDVDGTDWYQVAAPRRVANPLFPDPEPAGVGVKDGLAPVE